MQINGKVVLITGASEGVGAACARLFRAHGAQLCITARSESRLRATADSSDTVIAGDLTEPGMATRLAEEALRRCGKVDVLINNAGAGLYTAAHSGSEAEVRRLFDLNLHAPLALIRALVPQMKQRRSGCIVNVSSVAGLVPLPWFTMYSASKAALIAMTDGLRLELQDAGIHCISVCPGYVRTNFQNNLIAGTVPPALGSLKQRWSISPEQCAEAILRGIDRESRTVVAPASGWLLVAAARLFPHLVDRQLRAILLRETHA
jgi:short-subunit dehydrogenase